MPEPKYSEGDVVMTNSGMVAEIKEVDVLEDVFYYLYLREDDKNSILLERYIQEAVGCDNEDHSDTVYHDRKKRWLCPHCEL